LIILSLAVVAVVDIGLLVVEELEDLELVLDYL
jgi:hypothetical protein